MKRIFQIMMLGLIMASCSKEKTTAPPVEIPKRLVRYSSFGGVGKSDYIYNQDGRLAEIVMNSVTHKFFYQPGQFTFQFLDQNGTHLYYDFQDGKLDAEGRLTGIKAIYKQNGLPDGITQYTLTYNADGQIEHLSGVSQSTGDTYEYKYSYVNGNLTELISNVNGALNYREEFTYYDLPNKIELDMFDDIFVTESDRVTGKRSKQLRKTKRIYDHNNVVSLDYLYAYDMDADGFPVKQTLKNMKTNFESIYTYEYNK